MVSDLTVLYCSSCREAPEFEQRIRDNILEVCGGIPIVSVTQKPIDFGTNICVGDDIGVSGFNFFRQTEIGLRAIKTKFVISAESDCLYPPDYFQFIPPREDICYRNSNLYVMPQHRAFFWRKPEGATHAQVVGRDFYLARLEFLFYGAPEWSVEEKNFPKERLRREDVFEPGQIEYYESENPVVQIKTSQSMRHYTASDRQDRHELPYWGTGVSFRKAFYDIGRRH